MSVSYMMWMPSGASRGVITDIPTVETSWASRLRGKKPSPDPFRCGR